MGKRGWRGWRGWRSCFWATSGRWRGLSSSIFSAKKRSPGRAAPRKVVVLGKLTPRAPVSALRVTIWAASTVRAGGFGGGLVRQIGQARSAAPTGEKERLQRAVFLGRFAAVAAIGRMRVPHHPPGLKATPSGDCIRAAARTGALTPCGMARRPHPPVGFACAACPSGCRASEKARMARAWHPTHRARQWLRWREGKAGTPPWPSDASTPGLDIDVGPGAVQFADVGACAGASGARTVGPVRSARGPEAALFRGRAFRFIEGTPAGPKAGRGWLGGSGRCQGCEAPRASEAWP